MVEFPKGEVISDGTSLGNNTVTAKYKISYDVSGDSIISSKYYGNFTVMFEANI
ncbi:hypothetical protein [Photobacterium damselae]|uniref:hypothetical protein n=1 Tax=Photobacterium damselae TaxID=38293 RepID=UPI0035A84795